MKEILTVNPVCQKIVNDLHATSNKDVVLLQAPYPWKKSFENDIREYLARNDEVVVLVSELHNDIANVITRLEDPRLHFFTCGFVNNVDTHQWIDWFSISKESYRLTSPYMELHPYEPKPRYFDLLLGQNKPHRQYVYDWIVNNKYEDRVIMSYIKERGTELANTDWIWEPGIESDKDIRWTVDTVKFKGRPMSLSQIIPSSVYNETAYSVVAETNFDNHYSFYTEKIAKPILAERLFVVFSGKGYLENLRKLGFKTFDGIIDESYDLVEDHWERFDQCLEQIKYLMSRPQEEILEKIIPITVHNKQVMIETDWYDKLLQKIRTII